MCNVVCVCKCMGQKPGVINRSGPLSRDLLAVTEIEGPPLAIDEPERLVGKCGGRDGGRVKLGVNTTHETIETRLY